ncbi:MAG: LPS export ABC transporter periplasmic protein LptC [Bacteroidia bacterium]|nr:LPS export ABC transporter periplasmic protein LptC [Bacteroidia bacterium]
MWLLQKIGLLPLFIVVSFIITSCQTDRNEIMALGKKITVPDLTGKDVTMLYSDSTILKIKLQTPQMQKYEKSVKEPVTIMPKGLFVIFYDEKGKEATTLKADYGVRYEKSKRMEVKYNVEVININGEKLNTEHLIWDEQKKKIISDAFVKITTAKEIIMGKGLEANQDFTQYEIKEITGSIRVDDNEL